MLFMGGEYNEEEYGMQPTLAMHDDDKDSFGPLVLIRSGWLIKQIISANIYNSTLTNHQA